MYWYDATLLLLAAAVGFRLWAFGFRLSVLGFRLQAGDT
jgi:hypothetical protein